MSAIARCRYCDARILWIRLRTKSGKLSAKPHPVDRAATRAGNITLEGRWLPSGTPVGRIAGNQLELSEAGDEAPRYVSHFATCPHADQARAEARR